MRCYNLSVLGTYLLYYVTIISSITITWVSQHLKNIKYKKLSKWIFFSAIIIPVLIAGLRDSVGSDFDNYVSIYDQLYYNFSGIIDAIINSRFEPSWVILNYLVRFIFDDVQFLFLISALLTWLLSFKAIYDNKDYINIGLSVLILLFIYYNMSFNIVRQVLAISISMLSIKPILEKRKWKFIIIMLFSSSFHYTAFVFIPAYWIINSKIGNTGLFKKVAITLTSIVFVFFFQSIFNYFSNNINLFANYRNYNIEFSGFSISSIILKIPVLLFIILNIKTLKLRGNSIHRLSILYVIGFILMLLGSYSPYINRISFFYDATQIFLVPAIIQSQSNKYHKILYTYFVVLYYLSRFTYFYLYKGDSGTIPYNF